MMYLGDFAEDATVRFMWNTNAVAGESITRATNGTISVYKDGDMTQSTAGVTDTEDFDSLTGVHLCAIDTSADAFYAAGSEYAVVLSAASIDGKTINAVLAHFSIERSGGVLALAKGANGFSAIKTETASILEDTGTTIPGTLATLATAANLATVDTVVDGIKAVTDLLPDAGALTSLATAANLATVDTVVDAIKAKTDSLTFTTAGQVDANVQSVNDTALGGDGSAGDPWGPAA